MVLQGSTKEAGFSSALENRPSPAPRIQASCRMTTTHLEGLLGSPAVPTRCWLLCGEGTHGQHAQVCTQAWDKRSVAELFPGLAQLPHEVFPLTQSVQNTQTPVPRNSASPITRTSGCQLFHHETFNLEILCQLWVHVIKIICPWECEK